MQGSYAIGGIGGTNGSQGVNDGWVSNTGAGCNSGNSTVCSGGSGQGTGYGVCLASIKWHTASPGAGGNPTMCEQLPIESRE